MKRVNTAQGLEGFVCFHFFYLNMYSEWALNERPRSEEVYVAFQTEKMRHALFNWGIRACQYFYSVKKCPLPERVRLKTQELINNGNPIPAFLAEEDAALKKYEYDPDGTIPLKTFKADLRNYCKQKQISFNFDSGGQQFKMYLENLVADASYGLSLVGESGNVL